MAWVREHGGGLPTQVYPINDLRRHQTCGADCWCKPRLDVAEDGTTIVIHNDADGREDFEAGRRPS